MDLFHNITDVAATTGVYQSLDESDKRFNDIVVDDMTPKARKYIGFCVLGLAFGIYFALSAGGITRLDEAAMKMTDRNPFRWFPPFGHWEEEFEKYKTFDEYPLLTPEDREALTLGQFKFKWFLVYFHRMGGRMLFLAFWIPFIYFWSKGYFSAILKRRMIIAAILITSQIPIGWWMVNSGLHKELMANKKKPGVSQYRMAIHLIIPFFMYGIFLYTGLSMFLSPQDHSNVLKIKRLRSLIKFLIGGLFITSLWVCSFLAALDAAEPEYARKWIPDDLLVMNPKWINFFENGVTVNFIHRYFGYIAFATINVTYFLSYRMMLQPRAYKALNGVMVLGYAQLLLGISTLYFRDPAPLAWLHQNFSMILYTFLIWLLHETRHLPKYFP